ncbi:uncharacterized protein F4822DRAFT_440064 [Hypoxylon trugodes]|uniref:uncharacterized protein n=1 Tax=Hypoxylon trugodes TaxID=326681 RepID=UPI00219502F1|nr:uncharacterized protein F4822DRAFT_440064 [Hypoxylon trugodes]KAI1383837.1 hypothetical protein F4822DRAFT_440064 [Hypoxylon trugodes]
MSDNSPAVVAARRKKYFDADSRDFEFGGLIASGGHGDAYKIRERSPDGSPGRRFVAKFAVNDPISIADLRKEIETTRQLYGAFHIVQPVVDNGNLRSLPNIPSSAPAEDRLMLCMEYLPGITFADFIHRAQQWDVIPNRVLCMVFLCLLALGNPPRKPFGASTECPETEVVPEKEPTAKDYQIFHGDMDNHYNLVFGDFDVDEHWLVPVLKAIDFGIAIDKIGSNISGYIMHNISPGTFTQANIYHIGRAMQQLYAHYSPASLLNLDNDLSNLAAKCVSWHHQDRPSLRELVDTIEYAIRTKTGPESFPGMPWANSETTQMIRHYVADVMLSATQLDDFKVP